MAKNKAAKGKVTKGKAAKDNVVKKTQAEKSRTQEGGAKEPQKGKSGYLWAMSHAPSVDEARDGPQLIPLIFFTAFVILFVRMSVYTRPMEAFYWTTADNTRIDFFSYFKMILILLCAATALLLLLYRFVTQTLSIERSVAYIPMLVYSLCVLLSHAFSEYKDFALLGWNDRFEGTLVLLAYMVMLFFAINTIKTEKGVKAIVYAVAGSSALLGLLGLSQALDHDFFKTTIGKMLILPRDYWEHMDDLVFKFTSQQIYQTVYNINYVSFYLTLLVPLFGLLFIHSVMRGGKEALWKKALWGLLFTLALYNLVGSMSSGGYFGLGVTVIAAAFLLNKRIVKDWRKPVLMLLAVTLVIGVVTYDRWTREMGAAFSGVRAPAETARAVPGDPGSQNEPGQNRDRNPHIDYFNVLSQEYSVQLSVDGNEVTFLLNPADWSEVGVLDAESKAVGLLDADEKGLMRVDDDRFAMVSIARAESERGREIFVVRTGDRDWTFLLTRDGIAYRNDLGNIAELPNAEAIGWSNNLSFGSGRGYIWSRTLPLIKDTILIGYGADTYCAYFPHNDYIGKYNAGWVRNINSIVDKPHNMYMGMAVGTGLVSVFAFLALLLLYGVQSVRLLRKREYNSFLEYVSVSVFLGVVGFAAAALVNDSSVSVMPLFYGLLGTGFAANAILKRAADS